MHTQCQQQWLGGYVCGCCYDRAHGVHTFWLGYGCGEGAGVGVGVSLVEKSPYLVLYRGQVRFSQSGL